MTDNPSDAFPPGSPLSFINEGLAAGRRLRRSIDTHGVGGTIDLARPVARHTVVHGFSLVRLRVHILARRLFGLVRRRR